MSTRTRNTTTTSGQSVVQNGKSQNNIKRNLLNRREAAGRLTFPVNAKRNNANKVNNTKSQQREYTKFSFTEKYE